MGTTGYWIDSRVNKKSAFKVFWWLQNHKFFTHFHGEITGFSRTFHAEITLEFFSEISKFRTWVWKLHFDDTLAQFNCTWIERRGLSQSLELKIYRERRDIPWYTYHDIAISSFMCALLGSIFAQYAADAHNCALHFFFYITSRGILSLHQCCHALIYDSFQSIQLIWVHLLAK